MVFNSVVLLCVFVFWNHLPPTVVADVLQRPFQLGVAVDIALFDEAYFFQRHFLIKALVLVRIMFSVAVLRTDVFDLSVQGERAFALGRSRVLIVKRVLDVR